MVIGNFQSSPTTPIGSTRLPLPASHQLCRPIQTAPFIPAMRHALHSIYKKTAEAVLPPLQKSAFAERGVLTPEEFVSAADYLVHACPTWTWEGGDARKRRQFLPADKQYLVTRNVPCLRRAKELESYDPNSEFTVEAGEEGGEGWVATHQDPQGGGASGEGEDIPCLDGEGVLGIKGKGGGGEEGEEDIPDLADLELQAEEDEAALPASGAPLPSAAAEGPTSSLAGAPPHEGEGGAGPSGSYMRAEEPEDTIVRTRTYDLYITYDQYYQVPRFWLVGYDEARHPLAPDQVLDDVSEEHARKTITVEPHPNLSVTAASIHPCRHAETMKRLMDGIQQGGGTFAVEHYLLLFLKFIASVVPTIQYDYTMSIGQ